MKKTILILTAILLAFAFCSCGELTAYQLYTAAAEKAEASKDNFEANVSINVTVNGVGEKPVALSYDVHEKVDGNDVSAEITTDYGAGISVSGNAVYTDGCAYTDILGIKMKTPMTLEKFAEEYSFREDRVPAFDESDLKDVKVTKNEDGLREVKLTVSADKVNSAIDERVRNLIAVVARLTGKDFDDDIDAAISDVVIVITFGNDGSFKTIETDFALDADVFGKTFSANVQSKIEYLDFGSTSVELPDDAENYMETKNFFDNVFSSYLK